MTNCRYVAGQRNSAWHFPDT